MAESDFNICSVGLRPKQTDWLWPNQLKISCGVGGTISPQAPAAVLELTFVSHELHQQMKLAQLWSCRCPNSSISYRIRVHAGLKVETESEVLTFGATMCKNLTTKSL